MGYDEIKGNLFELDQTKWILAHCISADVTASKNMNKGIAKIFRTKYPEMAKEIQSKLQVGKAVKYQKGNHIIYNLISKHLVWQKAKGKYKEQYYENLYNALTDMKDKMVKNSERDLAMPRIASGLDGGDWEEISGMMKTIFTNVDINIQIHYL